MILISQLIFLEGRDIAQKGGERFAETFVKILGKFHVFKISPKPQKQFTSNTWVWLTLSHRHKIKPCPLQYVRISTNVDILTNWCVQFEILNGNNITWFHEPVSDIKHPSKLTYESYILCNIIISAAEIVAGASSRCNMTRALQVCLLLADKKLQVSNGG